MQPGPTPHDKLSALRLPYVLVLSLLLFIQIEPTIAGRAYTHFLGLNAAGTDDASLSGGPLLTSLQSIALMTIVLPCLIWVTSRPAAQRRNLSSVAIRLGLALWLGGAAASTLAYSNNPLVILNFFAGIGSGAAVFFAVRRMRLENLRRAETAFVAVALGALIPAVQGIVGFYRTWGVPTLQALPDIHYDSAMWQQIAPFGNADHVGTMYCLVAAPAMAIVAVGSFSKRTRVIAWVLLVCAGLNVILSFARASLATLALTILCAMVFARFRKGRAIAAAAVIFVLTLGVVQGANQSTVQFVGKAMRFDTSDPSTNGRVEAMQDSWQLFLDHPIVGVGAWQSPNYLDGWTAHQLAIWQAADFGVLALVGVMVLTLGCVGRLVRLLRIGCTSDRLCIEFVFLLAPAMYFIKGLVADANTNTTVLNTWICSAFAMLAIADAVAMPVPAAAPARLSLQRYITPPAELPQVPAS